VNETALMLLSEKSGRLALRLATLGLVCAALVSSACSSDGVTPDCPDLGKYRVRDTTEHNAALAKREAAAAKGCTTLPVAFVADGGAAGN
jgi:hypothetical protein